jgi:hypothetical protein
MFYQPILIIAGWSNPHTGFSVLEGSALVTIIPVMMLVYEVHKQGATAPASRNTIQHRVALPKCMYGLDQKLWWILLHACHISLHLVLIYGTSK